MVTVVTLESLIATKESKVLDSYSQTDLKEVNIKQSYVDKAIELLRIKPRLKDVILRCQLLIMGANE